MKAGDTRALRDAFGAFMTGVTVVTGYDPAGAPIGFTANSFASVSLDPPLLLVCLARSSRNFDTFSAASGFAVNVLSEAQKDISNTFAGPLDDRFRAVDWTRGPHGSPILGDVAAWFDCAMEKVVDAGDHVILLGRIEDFGNRQINGLGYARGSYFTARLGQDAVAAAGEDKGVKAAAVATQDDAVLLLERGDKGLTLPVVDLAPGEDADVFAKRLEEITGLSAAIGFVFAVCDHEGARMIVYRCELGPGRCGHGRFFAPGDIPLDRIADGETCTVLRRFVTESGLLAFANGPPRRGSPPAPEIET